jgi:hypothetical protein
MSLKTTKQSSGRLHNPQESNRCSACLELLVEEFQSVITF